MIKLGYTQTSRDENGPVFFFEDNGSKYRLRLAGNPILLIEWYYNMLWGEDFMLTYKSVKDWTKVNPEHKHILKEATEKVAEFFRATLEIQNKKKSLLVIYKG